MANSEESRRTLAAGRYILMAEYTKGHQGSLITISLNVEASCCAYRSWVSISQSELLILIVEVRHHRHICISKLISAEVQPPPQSLMLSDAPGSSNVKGSRRWVLLSWRDVHKSPHIRKHSVGRKNEKDLQVNHLQNKSRCQGFREEILTETWKNSACFLEEGVPWFIQIYSEI